MEEQLRVTQCPFFKVKEKKVVAKVVCRLYCSIRCLWFITVILLQMGHCGLTAEKCLMIHDLSSTNAPEEAEVYFSPILLFLDKKL